MLEHRVKNKMDLIEREVTEAKLEIEKAKNVGVDYFMLNLTIQARRLLQQEGYDILVGVENDFIYV